MTDSQYAINRTMRWAHGRLRKRMNGNSMQFFDQKVVVSIAILLASNAVTLSAAEPKSAPQRNDHQDLGFYVTADGNRRSITSVDNWKVRRRQILDGMQQAMGPLPRPAKLVPLDVQVV